MRPALRRAALVAGAVVLALVVAETALRLALGDRFVSGPEPRRPQDALGRHDDDLGWTLVPNARTHMYGEGVEYDVALNSHGYRGPAHDEPRAAGRRRIALLGDSSGFGWGVDDDATFAVALERDARVAADVVNLCVPGYSTDQELWTLEREGARVAPDLVLVQFSENDLEGNETTFAHKMVKPRFARDAAGRWRVENRPAADFVPVGVESPRFAERAFSRFATWQVLTGRVRLASTAGPPHPATSNVPSDPWGAESATRHAFELLVAKCRELRAPLVVFGAAPCVGEESAPRGGEFAYRANQSLAALGDELGFTTLAVDRPIADTLAAGRTILVPDGHWNAQGHRIVAEALAPKLAEILARTPKR